MIDLHPSHTPNGHEVLVTLEELGLDYEVHDVDLPANAQKSLQR